MDYKEKLQEAKRLYETANVDQRYVLESLFPELKESEDEKIRKALISFLKSPFVNENITDEKVAPWIVWLEKHGEQETFDYEKAHIQQSDFTPKSAMEALKGEKVDNQNCIKPADKVEPKFKAGDKIISTISNIPYYITEVCDEYYLTDVGCVIMFNAQDNFELSNQKTAWSEEDKEHIESILKRLDGMCKKGATFTKTCFAVNQDMEWLKSIKDRVQPQKHWKPSEEQMDAFMRLLIFKDKLGPSATGKALEELYEQLKAL